MTADKISEFISRQRAQIAFHRRVVASFGDKVYVGKFRPGAKHYEELSWSKRLWFVAGTPGVPDLALTFTSHRRALSWAIMWAKQKRESS